jgi:hypothetical protein
MVAYRIERVVPLPVDVAWRRLTTWERHGDHVPFTAVTVPTPPPTGVGTRFNARTGWGPVAFDDPMEVVRWEPPAPDRAGRCELVKRGRLVRGRSHVEAHPHRAGTRVLWHGDLSVRGLPPALDPLVRRSARWLYGRVVDALLAG